MVMHELQDPLICGSAHTIRAPALRVHLLEGFCPYLCPGCVAQCFLLQSQTFLKPLSSSLLRVHFGKKMKFLRSKRSRFGARSLEWLLLTRLVPQFIIIAILSFSSSKLISLGRVEWLRQGLRMGTGAEQVILWVGFLCRCGRFSLLELTLSSKKHARSQTLTLFP